MAELALTGVTKVLPGGTVALSGLTLHAGSGEWVAVLGPSGSGKTTTLRLVAGLESPSSGRISIDGVDVTDWPAERRDVGMVFQEAALYPHLDVARNLGFALRLRGLPPDETERRVQAEARALGLDRLLRRRPRRLSAGHRQAAALGRVTARMPRVFCMDEPLATLDPASRQRVRTELGRLRADLGVTALYVTDDHQEAMALGHRLAVLESGVLQQFDPPEVCYDRPANLFVAGFLGSPAIGTFPARLHVGGVRSWLVAGPARIPFPAPRGTTLRQFDGRRLVVGVRPEHTRLAAVGDPAGLAGNVSRVERHGSHDLLTVVTGAGGREGGGAVHLHAEPGNGVSAGARVTVGVDPSRCHLFDPDTGAAVWHPA